MRVPVPFLLTAALSGIARRLIPTAALVVLVCSSCSAGGPALEAKVAMSDGVRLATDIYLPHRGDGPWPVILERTPYNRRNGGAKAFVGDSYAVVIQNLRGTRDSEGEWDVFGHDGWGEPGRRDGVDTLHWIRQQEWCNGKVGVAGWSASGVSAQLLLAAAPDELDCAFINAASDNFYEAVFHNGCYRKNTIEEWAEGKEMLAEFARHPSYDDFWAARNARPHAATINTPVFILSGWFDLFQRSSTGFFAAVNNNGRPRSQGSCKLIMNTLAHAAPSGELEFNDRKHTNLDAAAGSIGDWFGHWLLGEENGVEHKPNVGLFLMTDQDAPDAFGNQWLLLDNWPPDAEPATFYLHDPGRLSTDAPDADDGGTSYVYDPAHPTPSLGGNNLYPPSGPHDQRTIEARDDVIEFETQPLDESLTVIGPIMVSLFASSSAPDTDFGARLCDVYPDGRSMLMNEGMVRARYRDSLSEEKFMEPGRVYEIAVDLWDTALTFAAGHRIRLDIFSCADPRYEPNPNTGEPFRRHTRTQPANNTIHHSRPYPSHLVLPVVNRDSLQAVHDPR